MSKTKKPVKEFTITRKQWARGGLGSSFFGSNSLRNIYTKRQCCLGFLARACGWKAKEILGRANINNLVVLATTMKESFGINPGQQDRAVFMNDSLSLSEPEREQELIDTFAEAGITVNFVD